jgi:pimeloyl-ACP methyl ester carboxylesterase
MTAPGELLRVNGTFFHVRRFGGASGPVILFEGGLALMSSCWAWIGAALAERARVIVYDRSGLGWSEDRPGVRGAEQIGREAAELINFLGIAGGPLVLGGHSMGALFNRALLKADPQLAASISAVIWLDPAHPDQMRNRALRKRMRSFLFSLESADLAASRNLPPIPIPLMQQFETLPPEEHRRVDFFLRSPAHLQTSVREARAWETSADYVRDVSLGTIPLQVISAQKHSLPGWAGFQENLLTLSTRAKHSTFTDASHLSLLSHQDHAMRAAAEIGRFLDELGL